MHAGCFIAPLTFQLFWHSFDIGNPNAQYKAPFANIYRGMAVIGTQASSNKAHSMVTDKVTARLGWHAIHACCCAFIPGCC